MSTKKKADKEEANLQKYLVGLDASQRHVDIYLDGQKANPGHKIVGEFNHDPVTGAVKEYDDLDLNGDPVMILAATRILNDLGIKDTKTYVFEDRASSAPVGGSYALSHDEREQAIRDGLSPADVQEEISENIDKAAKKYDKK